VEVQFTVNRMQAEKAGACGRARQYPELL